MSMRIHKLATYLRPDEAYTLIEFLDQMREMLLQAYGDDITSMLRQTSAPEEPKNLLGDAEPF